ncbi:MAG: cell division protein FtsW [Calditrichaeota bacterium]|nr:cell division protein FtsW [Calditrichota bacterium]
MSPVCPHFGTTPVTITLISGMNQNVVSLFTDRSESRGTVRLYRGRSRNGPTPLREFFAQGDEMLLLTAIALTCFGLVMIYSASFFLAIDKHAVDWYFALRQIVLMMVGFGFLYAGMKIDIGFYRRWARVILLTLIGVMILQALFGPVVHGTRRWLRLAGFTFQTSEAARCAVIIFVAHILAKDDKPGHSSTALYLAAMVPIGAMAAVTYFQRDFSAAAMMVAATGVVLLLAGMPWRTFLIGTGIAGIAGLAFVLRTAYQRDRLITYLFPGRALSEDNYQSFQSILGFGRGGIFGAGFGESRQKMLFLPEPHTDFIFSIIGEEVGLLGTTAVLFAFMVLLYRASNILRGEVSRFGFLLGGGLIFSLMMFALVHMGVTVGILPVTGLPLPFISAGGTSLIVSLWSVGVLWQLSRSGRT